MKHTDIDHECMWEEFTPEQIRKKIARQSNFSWAFYDIETSQARYDGENFEYLPFHQAVMIVIGKVRVTYSRFDQLVHRSASNVTIKRRANIVRTAVIDSPSSSTLKKIKMIKQ